MLQDCKYIHQKPPSLSSILFVHLSTPTDMLWHIEFPYFLKSLRHVKAHTDLAASLTISVSVFGTDKMADL